MCTGTTLAFFQQLVSSCNDASNISFKVLVIDLPQSLIILIDKLSEPCDLFGSRFFIIAKMSLISRDEKGKKEVKSYYFPEGCTEKFEIILLLTNKGGIIVSFCCLQNN